MSSTLITSAPRSAWCSEPIGPGRRRVRSSTRTPVSGARDEVEEEFVTRRLYGGAGGRGNGGNAATSWQKTSLAQRAQGRPCLLRCLPPDPIVRNLDVAYALLRLDSELDADRVFVAVGPGRAEDVPAR